MKNHKIQLLFEMLFIVNNNIKKIKMIKITWYSVFHAFFIVKNLNIKKKRKYTVRKKFRNNVWRLSKRIEDSSHPPLPLFSSASISKGVEELDDRGEEARRKI